MKTVLEAIEKRSSTRGYTEEELTKDELQALIGAALKAPTGANMQELHFSVVQKGNPVLQQIEDTKNKLRNAAPSNNFYFDAPTVIFISGDASKKWSSVDSGIAVENIALCAEGLGLGNLIIGSILDALRAPESEEILKSLDIPEGYRFEIAIAVGHKAVEKEPHTYDEAKQVSWL